MLPFVGYASSSVVETIGTLSLRIASICGRTFFIDEFVHSTTTSGFVDLMALLASSDTLTRSVRPRPATSPRSRPDLRRIDVDGADDLEALARRDLLDDPGADRARARNEEP